MQLVLPLPAAEAAAAPAFLEAFAAGGSWSPESTPYHPVAGLRVSGKGAEGPPDPFVGVKAAAAELERRYPGTRLAWLVGERRRLPRCGSWTWSPEAPRGTRLLLATVWTRPGPEVLNRAAAMNAISRLAGLSLPGPLPGVQPRLAPETASGPAPDPPPPSSGCDLARAAEGQAGPQASAEGCSYNADYLVARPAGRDLAGQEEEEALEGGRVMDVFLRFSGLHLFSAVEPGGWCRSSFPAGLQFF